jgi:hypothetical protein
MQSLLQYRRIGLAVQKQLRRDEEKRAGTIPTIPEDKSLEQNLSTEGHPDSRLPIDDSSSESPEAQSIKDAEASEENEESTQVTPTRTRLSERIALGRALTGVLARKRTTIPEGSDPTVFVVGWEGKDDPTNPKNRSTTVKIVATIIVSLIAFVVTAASAIDTAVLSQAAAEFGVSDVVESIATGKLS